jgi:short-subunit dehydrogenase
MAAKLALVTGASGGLGLEFAKLLARAGYNVALVARSGDALERAASELRSRFGVSAEALAMDLSKPGSAGELFARIPACEVLVNNAGFASYGNFAEIPEERIREEIQLDVATLAELTRLYLPGMIARKDGKVLNVASTSAFAPGPTAAVYYAGKAFVLSFSEAIAYELRGTGVTVTCLCPGATATGFAKRAGGENALLFRLPVGDAAKVAKAGIDGMMRGTPVVVPGLSNKFVAFSPRITPKRLLIAISAKLLERSS